MAEKSISELPPDLRRLHTRGTEAARAQNFDYAIDLFNQILDKEPGCHECRAALRAVQVQKAGDGGGFFKKAFSTAGSSPQIAKAKMALQKNPAEALAIAEQILNGDPSNSFAHKIAAEAAQAMEMPHTAVLSLESLVKLSPKDKAATMQLAAALVAAGDAVRAEQVLQDICRVYPRDGELASALKNASASKTMSEGGYETLAGGEGSYRDILRNTEESVSLEQEKRAQKTEDVAERLIGEYEARLKTEPDNLKLLRSLAELYTQKKTVRPRAGLLRARQKFGHGQRFLARPRHRGHHQPQI